MIILKSFNDQYTITHHTDSEDEDRVVLETLDFVLLNQLAWLVAREYFLNLHMTWIAFLDLHCRMDHSKTEYNYKYNDSS
jgi:hypothetical protein